MANTLSMEVLNSYKLLLDAGNISGFYDAMLNNGYAYAGWAVGVAEADTIAGRAALDFLNDSAMPGVIGSNAEALSSEVTANIKKDMAQAYLTTTDRANMLQWLIKYNEEDIGYQKILSVGELKTYTELSSPLNEGKDLTLNLDKDISDVPDKQIKFGTEYDDGILGADNDDRLYGGGGKDAILGKDGDDYIEGGKGNDTVYSHVDFTLSDNSYLETIRAVNTDDLQQETTDNVDLTGSNTFYLLAMAA